MTHTVTMIQYDNTNCSNNERFYSSDHSYPLVDGLTPSIRFSIVQNKYMGQPYTRKSEQLGQLGQSDQSEQSVQSDQAALISRL